MELSGIESLDKGVAVNAKGPLSIPAPDFSLILEHYEGDITPL
jgi:hypothetical protein